MKHPARQHSASVNVGGQEVNINIDMGGDKPMGPIHLAGDERKLPKGAVDARSQQDMHMSVAGTSSTTFSNPKQNAHRLGFREGMKVADFGSGSGAYTLAVAGVVGDSGTVYAVDVQRDLLTKVQNNAVQEGYENVEIIWSDIESEGGVGLRDNFLDGVLISNTLFQVDDRIAVIKEAWRVLKPGGLLSVIDWTDSFAGLGPQQNMVITQTETTVLCTDNGFALKGSFSAGEHHYGLIFIKMLEGESNEEVVAHSHKQEQNFVSRTIAQELI